MLMNDQLFYPDGAVRIYGIPVNYYSIYGISGRFFLCCLPQPSLFLKFLPPHSTHWYGSVRVNCFISDAKPGLGGFSFIAIPRAVYTFGNKTPCFRLARKS